MDTIGERIKAERESLRLKPRELAECISNNGGQMSRSALVQLESGGTKNPKPNNLLAAAKCLNVNVEWLTTGKGKKEVSKSWSEYFGVDTSDSQEEPPQTELEKNLSEGISKNLHTNLDRIAEVLSETGYSLTTEDVEFINHYINIRSEKNNTQPVSDKLDLNVYLRIARYYEKAKEKTDHDLEDKDKVKFFRQEYEKESNQELSGKALEQLLSLLKI